MGNIFSEYTMPTEKPVLNDVPKSMDKLLSGLDKDQLKSVTFTFSKMRVFVERIKANTWRTMINNQRLTTNFTINSNLAPLKPFLKLSAVSINSLELVLFFL